MTYVHRVRVRYGECDMQTVVFNAHYWRTATTRSTRGSVRCSRRMAAASRRSASTSCSRQATLTWHAPLAFGETADLACSVERWGNASFDVVDRGHGRRRARVHGDHHLRAASCPGRTRRRAIPELGARAARRMMRRLARDVASPRDSPIVAPELLNKVLVVGECVGRIIEVEAYMRARPGEPHVPRPTAAQRGDVRPGRPPVRVLHLRHAPLRQHRHRASSATARRC